MNCSNCNNEFNFIEGLKFCPYCGSKIGRQFVDLEEDHPTVTKEEASLKDNSLEGESSIRELLGKDYFRERAFREDYLKKNTFRKAPLKSRVFMEGILQDKNFQKDIDFQEEIYEEKTSLEEVLEENFDFSESIQEKKVIEETDSLDIFQEGPSVSKTEGAGEEPYVGNINDTLKMPSITDQMLEMNKTEEKKPAKSTFLALRKLFKSKLVIVACLTVMVLSLVIYIGSAYLLNQKVEVGQIKKDMSGRTIVLPKGTKFQVKEEYIKSISLGQRAYNEKEKVEYIDLTAAFNDGKIEVTGVLQLAYKKEGNNKWRLLDSISLKKDIVVKPVAGMKEGKIIEEVKKQTISLFGQEIPLSDSSVTSIKVLDRDSQFQEGKENISLEIVVDGGILSAKGTANSSLIFAEEKWFLDGNLSLDEQTFEISLSENLSEDLILNAIKDEGKRENVKHDSIFGGQNFLINDKFTKSTSIQSKALSDNKNQLYVSVKKENVAGMLNTTLTGDYVFNVSLNQVNYNSNTESRVEEVSVGELTRDMIVSSLAGAVIEGRRGAFWWDNNHEITEGEAKSYEEDEILSKVGYQNIKYVYGKLTYDDDGDQKTVDMVAIYYLTYDNNSGYDWKLDSVISSESNRYRHYSKESIRD